MTELHHLIHQLTQHHDIPITRHGHHLGTRRSQPLLTHRANAVIPSTGTIGGSNTTEPRLGFDATASTLHTTIRHHAHRWAINASVPQHWTLHTGRPIDWRDPADLLTAWHARAQHLNPAPYAWHLNGWITAIRDLVTDPPKRLPLDAPCPHCGERWTLDPDGLRVDALRILIRDPAPTSETICRACGAHWAGLDGAERLADLLRRTAS